MFSKRLSNEEIYNNFASNTLLTLENIWSLAGYRKSFKQHKSELSQFLKKTFYRQLELLQEAGLTTSPNKQKHFEMCIGIIYCHTYAYSYCLIKDLSKYFSDFSDDIIAAAMFGTMADLGLVGDYSPEDTAEIIICSDSIIETLIKLTKRKAIILLESEEISELKTKIIDELSDAEYDNDIQLRRQLRKQYYEFLCEHPVLGDIFKEYKHPVLSEIKGIKGLTYDLFERVIELLKDMDEDCSENGEYIPIYSWGFKEPLLIICEFLDGWMSPNELNEKLKQYFDEF